MGTFKRILWTRVHEGVGNILGKSMGFLTNMNILPYICFLGKRKSKN